MGEPIKSDYTKDEKQWAMFVHLSQLANFIAPTAGIIAPIVIWQLKKDEMPAIDTHGKIVVNWLISAFIYALVCVPLTFVIIGIPLLIALSIVSIVFPIIGGIKANNGEIWNYPMSIKFLK